MKRWWHVARLLGSVVLLLSSQAGAFQLVGSDWSYRANPMGDDWRICPNGMPGEAVQRTKDGGQAWNYSGFAFTFGSEACLSHGQYPLHNQVNQVDFGGPLPRGVLAENTRWFLAHAPSETIECDMRFSNVVDWYTGTDTPGRQQSDWWSVAAHEMGHCLGLDHEDSALPLPVMSTRLTVGTSVRALAPDDIAGRQALYGAPAVLVAAVLPGSRSVRVGTPATAFATVINTGASLATGCSIALRSNVAAVFTFQATDPRTNAVIGLADTPVDLAPSQAQTFVLAFTPQAAISSTDVQLSFRCRNTAPAAVLSGLNTLLLSASTSPIPDIVALAATPNNNGIVDVPAASGTGIFSVATVNLGASATMTATADTAGVSLPVTITLCATNAATGACLAAPAPSVTLPIPSHATPTFGVFITANAPIPFDPARHRLVLRLQDSGGTTRGATSVAVRTP